MELFLFARYRHVDAHKADYITALKDAVAIKSVSAWAHTRAEITTMVDWTVDKLKALGTTIELADVGVQTMHDGSQLPLPKVILGILGNVSEIMFGTVEVFSFYNLDSHNK